MKTLKICMLVGALGLVNGANAARMANVYNMDYLNEIKRNDLDVRTENGLKVMYIKYPSPLKKVTDNRTGMVLSKNDLGHLQLALGGEQCVGFAKAMMNAHNFPTSSWRPETSLASSPRLSKGTVIVAFDNGIYNGKRGHVALFLFYTKSGAMVVDQNWNEKLNSVSFHEIRYHGNKDCSSLSRKQLVSSLECYSTLK